MAKQTYLGQEVLFQTSLYGKDYVWMKDGDGTVYLLRLIDGVPQF
jgi:hypothetical protein